MYTRVQFMLTEDLYRRLRQAAEGRGMSMSQFVREALERALAEDAEARRQRRRQVLAELERAAQWIAEHAPDLVHTPEDLQAMREERDEALCLVFSPEVPRA
ncbi:MAG TPA: ribbon-helix-helix protein, CopG family [Anaerolineae bacterium]|nr:ribbon-helix-helix protein, CopG family [Anaerolineae bacterium]HID83936.1 ribbon-helix-helix protein, CopG family [Anaerolineales bacterium]HIQ08947.1 ribbon-helix-helix protein, CopG family [Anaerolineaceae bacterium]